MSKEKLPDQFWKIDGAKPGPTITILGGVHGNETIGVTIVHKIRELVEAQGIEIGTLYLGIGNPAAVEAKKRYLVDDLNRCFGIEPNPGTSDEQKRAEEIKPILAKSDVMFDIHSTINPTDHPFIIIPGHDDYSQHPYAAAVAPLGISKTITGGGLGDVDTDSFTAHHGGLGITIEAGWQESPDIEAITYDTYIGVIRALKKIGVLHPDTPNKDLSPDFTQEHLEAYHDIIATEGFEFEKPWQNFELIKAGEEYAHDENGPIIATQNSQIIFAKSKPNIITGKQAGILLACQTPQ